MADDAQDDEPLASTGLAATLRLLSNKGAARRLTREEREQEKADLERRSLLAQVRLEEHRRAQEATKQRWTDAGEEEREAAAERRRVRELEQRFREYKPNVQISHVDEFGRELTPKEAFKQLCYGFHGQKPGKRKTEKRLRRIEEEARRRAADSSDAPLQVASALQRHMAASESAHVVLSVGNRGTRLESTSRPRIDAFAASPAPSVVPEVPSAEPAVEDSVPEPKVPPPSQSSPPPSQPPPPPSQPPPPSPPKAPAQPSRAKITFGFKRKAPAAAGAVLGGEPASKRAHLDD